ncbi:MAG: GGDEF domain-containing protein [Chromatiales bacterium]|nr:GGDEF domain-containing protein [Chromatiales bacterium]
MQETSVISSLVELTKQRDQLSIRAKLLSTLMEATDASWIVLCRLLEDETIEVLDRTPSPSAGKSSKHYPAELFEQAEHFQQCLRMRRPVWVTNLQPYQAMILHMSDNGDTTDFVVLFNPQLEGRDERTASSILDLYENFIALVIENTHDPLTGLLNRGAFDRDLETASSVLNVRNRRTDSPKPCSYLAMLDIDHFKRINDRYGHLYGDEVLLLFAKIFRDTFRETDKLYRYGGEEFAVIIDNCETKHVDKILERFRIAVSEFDFPQVGSVTVSIGAAPITANSLPSNIVDRADQALYVAKEKGRNQVQISHFVAPLTPQRTSDQEVELF